MKIKKTKIMKKAILFTALLIGTFSFSFGQARKLELPKSSLEKIKTNSKVQKPNERSRSQNPDQSVFLYHSTQYDTIFRESYKYVAGTSLISEALNEYYDNGVYVNSYKNVYTYNSSDLMTSRIEYMWDGTQFEPSSKTVKAYDQYDNEIEYTYYYWDMNDWVIGYGNKTSNTYTATGKILVSTISEFDINTAVWTPYYRMTNTYNASSYQTSVLYEMYDAGNWENMSKEEYTLNASGHWSEIMIFNWDLHTNDWQEETKVIGISWLDFDEFLVLEGIIQTKNNNVWENEMKILVTYNGNKMILSETYQRWLFGSWVNSERNVNTYDAKNNLTENLYQNYLLTWITNGGQRYLYDYAANGNVLSIEDSFYDMGQWIKSGKRINIYFSSSIKNSKKEHNLSVYPNPVMDRLTIELNSDNISIINVFNISGQNVISRQVGANSGKVNIDVANLNSGVYFIQVISGNQTTTQKLIKK
jgi:hypothetical protein